MINLNDRKTGLLCYFAIFSFVIFPIISIGIGTTEAQGFVSGPPDNKVVVYYSFDNINDVENDDSGKGLDIDQISGAIQTGNGLHGRNLYFDGDADFTKTNADPDLNIVEDITISVWVYYIKPPSSEKRATIVMKQGNFRLHINSEGNDQVRFESGNANWDFVQSSSSIPEYEWTHIVATRDGDGSVANSIKIFINGIRDVQGSINPDSTPSGGLTNDMYIGSWKGTKHYFQGYIDEVRISDVVRKGGGTVAFWNFNEGSGSSVRNRSPQNIPRGTISGASWGTGKYGKALTFDGSNDYVIVAPEDSMHLTGDLTIEAWVRYDAGSGGGTRGTIVAQPGHFRFHYDKSTGKVRFEGGNSPWWPIVESSIALPDDVWTHVAVTRSGDGEGSNSVKIYINGMLNVQGDTYEPTGTSPSYTYIGSWSGTNHFFKGRIDELRISNYVKTFGATNGYGGDVLLLPFEGGSYNERKQDHSPHNNHISSICGNPDYGSGYGKYGGCHAFDGIDDYLYTSPNLDPSMNPTAMLSVEAWIHPYKLELACIVDNSNRAAVYGDRGGFILRLREDGKIQFYFYIDHDTTKSVTSNVAVTTNRWFHIAGVYDGYNLRVYINGVCEGITPYQGTIFYGKDWGLFIGCGYKADKQWFEGLIDEVRISNYPRSYHEDTDGDGMSDMYEIMRSIESNQYNPMEHNGRYGLLVAPVRENEDIQFKYDITQMRHYLKSIGWNDDDMIFLTCDTDRTGLTLGDEYNGDWIDGEAYHDNLDGSAQHDTAFDAFKNGGAYKLQDSNGNWNSFFFSKITNKDIFLLYLRNHGGLKNNNYIFGTYSHNNYGANENDYWTATDLDTRLDNDVDCKYMACVLDFCDSGMYRYSLTGDRRLIVTSTSYTISGSYKYLFYGRIRGDVNVHYAVFDDDASMTDQIICEEKHWTDLDGDGRIDVYYNYNYQEYQDDGDRIFEPDTDDTLIGNQIGQSLRENKYDHYPPFDGNEEINNADGISGVNGNRDREDSIYYRDKFISIQEAHYMGNVVCYDRGGGEPQISKGIQIPSQLYL